MKDPSKHAKHVLILLAATAFAAQRQDLPPRARADCSCPFLEIASRSCRRLAEWGRGFLYFRALYYLLRSTMVLPRSVGIIADIFMAVSFFETITSKEKRVPGTDITYKVWNATVANLTLMALGSSAPEILLSVIEILTNDFFTGRSGTRTIVGSAAFNLFCIIAICVVSLPDGETRKIEEVTVYKVTGFFSVFVVTLSSFIDHHPHGELAGRPHHPDGLLAGVPGRLY